MLAAVAAVAVVARGVGLAVMGGDLQTISVSE